MGENRDHELGFISIAEREINMFFSSARLSNSYVLEYVFLLKNDLNIALFRRTYV